MVGGTFPWGKGMRASTLAACLCAAGIGANAGCGREGQLPAGRDTRTGIMVPAAARDAVMTEMRTMLGSVNGVLVAQARGDTAALRRAAIASGTAAAADPALERILPAAWLTLAMNTHQQFDELARAGDSVTVRLARLTGNCVACHAAYRLELRE